MMGAWPTLVLDASKTEWWESRVGRPFWFADKLACASQEMPLGPGVCRSNGLDPMHAVLCAGPFPGTLASTRAHALQGTVASSSLVCAFLAQAFKGTLRATCPGAVAQSSQKPWPILWPLPLQALSWALLRAPCPVC